MIKRVIPLCFYTREPGKFGSSKYTFISNGKIDYQPYEKPPLPGKGCAIKVDGKSYTVEDIDVEGTFTEDGNRTRVIIRLA
jgi:hypothetical protein